MIIKKTLIHLDQRKHSAHTPLKYKISLMSQEILKVSISLVDVSNANTVAY